MIVVWRIFAVEQRSKEVRTQGASRYNKEVHFLRHAERKERISTPEIDEKFEKGLTP